MRACAWSLCLCGGLLLAGCDSKDDKGTRVASGQSKQVMKIDKRTRSGRMFLYLDDSGKVVRTADYDSIPAKHRGAVVVQEGRKRSRVKRTRSGRLEITAMPPRISASDEQQGAEAAERLLDQNPPEPGPPSSETWTDEQWREEVRRELEELRREQEQQ